MTAGDAGGGERRLARRLAWLGYDVRDPLWFDKMIAVGDIIAARRERAFSAATAPPSPPVAAVPVHQQED